jgi:molecular chaperone DnaK
MTKIIGIDLGTTFSAMAIIEAGEPKIIENREGARTTPSVIAIDKKGERLCGVLAQRQMITNPENTVFGIKRLIGRKFSDSEVQKDKDLYPYQLREASDGGVEVKIRDQWYKPIQISAMILEKLKADAEDKLGVKIEEAIITCPAYFNDAQRQETKAAGEIAGFKVRRVINEPTAAALSYGLHRNQNQQILVYDFGGGTFDASILDISEDTIEVKGTGGDTHLGGNDFDQEIIDWVIKKFKNETGIDLQKDSLALQRIKEAAEKAKIELSTTLETEINLPFITSTEEGPKHLQYSLSRSELEKMVENYIQRSIEITKKVIKEADLEVKDIEEIVLVGGQTRMPRIQEEVKKLTNKEPNKSINPDEVVAIGAAIQGGIIQGEMKDVLLLDVTPLSLGIETLGGVNTILIEKNTTVPTKKSQVFSTAADSQTSVEIHVLQGERPMASDNKSLGKFILDGIPAAPKGIPQIEVTFDIDANGILNVKALDKGTGKEKSVRVENSASISKEEIERLKKEAEAHAEEDKKKKEAVEQKNQAEFLIHTAEKTLEEGKDKVEKNEKEEIQKAIEELKKALSEEKNEEIKDKSAQLSSLIQKIGAKFYQNQAPEGKNDSSQEKPEEKPEENSSDSSEEKKKE